MVPTGSKPFILNPGSDGSVLLEQAHGEATQDSKVLSTAIFAQAALIFAEGNIQNLVERIFNAPMGTHIIETLRALRWVQDER